MASSLIGSICRNTMDNLKVPDLPYECVCTYILPYCGENTIPTLEQSAKLARTKVLCVTLSYCRDVCYCSCTLP